MSWSKITMLWCDEEGCTATLVTGTGHLGDAKSEARRKGWGCTTDGWDGCPAHKETT